MKNGLGFETRHLFKLPQPGIRAGKVASARANLDWLHDKYAGEINGELEADAGVNPPATSAIYDVNADDVPSPALVAAAEAFCGHKPRTHWLAWCVCGVVGVALGIIIVAAAGAVLVVLLPIGIGLAIGFSVSRWWRNRRAGRIDLTEQGYRNAHRQIDQE